MFKLLYLISMEELTKLQLKTSNLLTTGMKIKFIYSSAELETRCLIWITNGLSHLCLHFVLHLLALIINLRASNEIVNLELCENS